MNTYMATIVGLFIWKHFVFDFIFQTRWIGVGKFKDGIRNWFMPLLIHSAINASGTAMILLCMHRKDLLWLAYTEIAVHFIIDRGKVYINKSWGWTHLDEEYWILIGLDQALHYSWYLYICTYLIGVEMWMNLANLA